MKSISSLLLVAFLILSLNSLAFAVGQQGTSSGPSAGAVVGDILVLRPLGFVGTVLGSAAFVVSLPVTLPTHQVDKVGKALVERPFNYTFERPIGQM
jgi:hypothetical protein